LKDKLYSTTVTSYNSV